MSRLTHVQAALGWFLVGLLLTYLLINIVGFVSPFWGYWMHPDDPSASLDLLRLWQPYAPWFSVVFAVAAWHLAMTRQSLFARIAIIAAGVLVPVAHVVGGYARRAIEQSETPVPPQWAPLANLATNAYIALAALVFVALVWSAVRQSNRSLDRTSLLDGIDKGELAVAEGRAVTQADAKDRLAGS